MSVVEVISVALAAGASAGLRDTTSVAVRDAYVGLKSLLGRRMADRDEVRLALEADEVEPEVWQTRIGDALVDSGAANDEEVVALAERLLALADPARAAQFDIKVGTNYGAIGTFSAPVTFNQGPPLPPSEPAA
jgi:hypothetical protein